MPRFLTAAITTALIFLAFCGLGSTLAASPNDTTGKTIPQGQDPLGADDEQTTQPPAEHKGVIKPPPVGAEDIYPKVPNPEVGNKKEVMSRRRCERRTPLS
jgi:hypothetical protein